jgi:hypothetical protein
VDVPSTMNAARRPSGFKYSDWDRDQRVIDGIDILDDTFVVARYDIKEKFRGSSRSYRSATPPETASASSNVRGLHEEQHGKGEQCEDF